MKIKHKRKIDKGLWSSDIDMEKCEFFYLIGSLLYYFRLYWLKGSLQNNDPSIINWDYIIKYNRYVSDYMSNISSKLSGGYFNFSPFANSKFTRVFCDIDISKIRLPIRIRIHYEDKT